MQRFGSVSLSGQQPWGIRVGPNRFIARSFFAIKPEWNDLSTFTTGVIPRGTEIRVGLVGPQGWTMPGGLLQFNVNSGAVVGRTTTKLP